MPPDSLENLATPLDISRRLRRNRKSPAIRAFVQETRLHPSQLIAPLFLLEGEGRREEILNMPGVHRLSIDLALKEIEELYSLGIRGINLFPLVPAEKKDPFGSEALRDDNLINRAIKRIKHALPEMCIMVDVALDPYTSHGHDGLINEKREILNDETVILLAKVSIGAAAAGADIVAPSDMMDGRVSYIRHALDQTGHTGVSILSYAAKYASAFYSRSPETLHSVPKFDDKTTYQINPANVREALIEISQDEMEGADMLLIKPALPYLDVITKVKERTDLPLGAYHVSGEYAMIKAAAEKGWIDGERAMMKSLISIKRAGADFILTCAAKEAARQLNIH